METFSLILRKLIYFCEYMDSLGKFKERQLPDKKELYSNLVTEILLTKVLSMQKRMGKRK